MAPSILYESETLFKEKIVVIREMGINPLRLQFVSAILAKVLFSKSPWERKLDLYKRWGWSAEEVLAAFKMYPWHTIASTDKNMAAIDIFANKMGCKSLVITRCSIVITLGLKKKIIPRCAVL